MGELSNELAAARFKTAMDLFDAGVDLQRQNLQRKFPGADRVTIEALLRSWLLRENEPGDAEGKPGTWPREKKMNGIAATLSDISSRSFSGASPACVPCRPTAGFEDSGP